MEMNSKRIAKELLREDLAVVLSALSPKERDVLRLRFGMDDGRERSLQEVSKLFGVTEKEISEMETNALSKLKHPNLEKW